MTTFPIPPNYPNHILVASPSRVVRQRVLESLRSPVRRFEQVTGGAEALVHLESGFWQELFLDRLLPDLDAEELSHTVRQRYPGIEVVLLDSEFETNFETNFDKTGDVDATPIHVGADAFVRPAERSEAMENEGANAVLSAVHAARSTAAAPLPGEASLPGMIGNSRIM